MMIRGNGDVFQTSTFGDGARYYRIDMTDEHYITNFQTLRTPIDYTVEIWRGSLLIDDFGFETARRRNDVRYPSCGYPVDQSRKWESYSRRGAGMPGLPDAVG